MKNPISKLCWTFVVFTKRCAAVFFFIIFTQQSFAQQSSNLIPITVSRCNQFTFDASNSYDPDKGALTYSWDFGDGTTGENSAVIDHTYKKSGDYKVSLTITDNSPGVCNHSTREQVVRANLRPTAVFAAPETVCAKQPIVFDGSESYDDAKNTLKYEWDFGDGTTASGGKTSKTYQKSGTYKVILTVDDGASTSCSSQSTEKHVTVNEPPSADAGEEKILKCIGNDDDLLVSFDASKSGNANPGSLSYHWDFGDGSQGEGEQVTHRYSKIGSYDVRLTVKDSSKTSCGTAVDFISVKLNDAPRANAGDDIAACVNDDIAFDGTNSYTEKKGTANIKWSFGDGQTSEILKTTHRYTNPGQYQASLSIEDQLNSMCPIGRDTRNVTINSKPTVSLNKIDPVCVGTTVNFDASGSFDPDGNNLEYYWSFGDGTVLKAGSKVSHEYKTGGEYKATVVIDDGIKTPCSTSTAETVVKVNTPPSLDIGQNLSCCADQAVEFDAGRSSDADGNKLTFLWDFGDGTTSNAPSVQHAFSKSGKYTVTLTVDDNQNTSCSKISSSFISDVNASPVAVMDIR